MAQTTTLRWFRSDRTSLWATARATDNGKIHLIVEHVPGGKWDWAVWRAGWRHRGRTGVAPTSAAAVTAAEEAATILARATF